MGAKPSSIGDSATDTGKCPVDHGTRQIWLQQHSGHSNDQPIHPPKIPEVSDISPNPSGPGRAKLQRPLSADREVSGIPRALASQPTSNTEWSSLTARSTLNSSVPPATASHTSPPNSETETGHDPATGNWIYPSERQFYDALIRKNNIPASATSARELATSVASIIPIHNAVNERAWAEILEWEKNAPTSDPGSQSCGGPRLYSFRGLGTEERFLSPRARFNGWMGYQRPFDRHDWVVQRCGGERVEYVIDFYQGKSIYPASSTASGLTDTSTGKLSFYLDVRPKLNSVEGWQMRFSRFWGL
jgi:cytochrome c heme-lyase